MQKEALISFFKMLAPIEEAEEALIRSVFSSIKIPAKTFLVREGEINHTIYFVVNGCARIGINTPEGEDISCYFAQEMEWISVYESFLTGTPSQYFIQTLEDCEMLITDRMGIETIFTEIKNGNLIGRKLTEGLLIQTVEKLTNFYRFTPEERFQNFVEANPQLANRIPQNCLASYIGVKPQSLSRIKKRVFSAN